MEVSLKEIRPTFVVVEVDNIIHNLCELKRLTAKKSKSMAVVKADAYGHGALEVSRACCENGIDYLGVAILEEGIFLREHGVTKPILILGATFPERANDVVKYELTQGVSSVELVKALSFAAKEMKKTALVHIKIETGMNRLGAIPGVELKELIQVLDDEREYIKVEGVFSHFAKADAEDKAYAMEQVDVFAEGIEELEEAGFTNLVKHISNSAAILELPQAHIDMVRQGISLYGYYPSQEVRHDIDLRPALSWITHIAHIKRIAAGSCIGYGCTYVTERESVIATLPVGYADGYPRLLSNCGSVIVRGSKAPIVGRVCMDQMMVDVTDIRDVDVKDAAILIGKQGRETITADDLASQTGTISYEILTGISQRVPRVFKAKGELLMEDRLNSRKKQLKKSEYNF